MVLDTKVRKAQKVTDLQLRQGNKARCTHHYSVKQTISVITAYHMIYTQGFKHSDSGVTVTANGALVF